MCRQIAVQEAVIFSRLISLCAFLFLVSFCVHASPLADEVHHYREVTGDSIKEVTWQLHRGDALVLTYSSPTERHTTTTNQDYHTIRWEAVEKEVQTHVVAMRNGDVITIDGRFNGETVHKTLKIDGTPWFQATSLSLRELVATSDSQREFWTIRFDTLTAHKLMAAKKGIKTIESDGLKKQIQRIRLRPAGLLAPFWQSDYWFMLPDNVFYRFEGPSGPPGSPMTVVTLADR